MATTFSDFVKAVNSGKAVVRCTTAGELVMPVTVSDEKGNRTVNIHVSPSGKVDLAKRLPRKTLLESPVIRQRLVDGSITLV